MKSSSSSVMKSSKMESSSTAASTTTSGQQQHHHRKNTFASTENVNNAILCRPAQGPVATTTGIALHATNGSASSLSVSGYNQRKSISNLNDSAMYATTNRTSYSSLHRRGKESTEARMQNYVKTVESDTIVGRTVRGQACPPPSLAGLGLGSSTIGSTSHGMKGSSNTSTSVTTSSSTAASNQKTLRDYHTAMNVSRSSTKANASSISFGDDKFHGSSSYKVQYIQQHEGRCPAAVHDNLKLSKVTKQHTYYVRDQK
uniref:Uncharacterized protein n=2 Tax=Anopheles albimanus TaxID=7167 RepID=A0A182F5Y3_ANOAL